LKQWDKFKQVPWGVLAHSTHVRGLGTFENGLENCRAKVTLASQIPRDVCERINLGYRDPQDHPDRGICWPRRRGSFAGAQGRGDAFPTQTPAELGRGNGG